MSGIEKSANFFLGASAAADDRNPIDLYFDTGFTFKSPIASRPDVTLGLGFAFGRISRQAAASDRDVVALTGTPMPIRDYEAAIELTGTTRAELVAAAGPPVHHSPWRSRRQSARSERRLADPERGRHRHADDPEILIRTNRLACSKLNKTQPG